MTSGPGSARSAAWRFSEEQPLIYPPEQIKREYAARRRRQILITLLFMAPVVLVAFLLRTHATPVDPWFGVPFRTWLIASFGLLLVGVVASFFNWRCPACGAGLTRTLNHPFCPYCGAALQ